MLEFAQPNLIREVDSRPREAATISRRNLLKGMLATTIAVTTDSLITAEHWPETPTELYVLDGPDKANSWLAVPGYGSIKGKKIARQVRANPAIPDEAPIGAYVYGNEVVLIDDLKAQAEAFAKQQCIGSLSLYCHSMGGVIGLNVARSAGLPIRDIILNGSPFDMSDARQHVAAQTAAIGSELTGYRGSLASKYIGALLKRFTEDDITGPADTINAFETAAQDAWHGASPYTMASQLTILRDNPLEPTGYDGIMEPGFTRVAYCMPADIEADQTVYDAQAADKYAAFFATLGVTMERLYLPEPKHANTVDAMSHTADFINHRYHLNNNTAANAALGLVQNG